jgi:hypothetical protein
MNSQLCCRLLWLASVWLAWITGSAFAQADEAAPALAASGGDDAALARRLFSEGRMLLDRDQPQAACARLERSQKLAPALGTLLNLGLCHKRSDRLATAHDYYRQTEVMATLAGDTERREFAHEEAATIASQRATLTIRLSNDPNLPLEVRLDEQVQAHEAWQNPIFIDAGEHRVRVQAPGFASFESPITVQDGGKYLLVVPELRAENGAEPVQPAPPTAAPPSVQPTAASIAPAAVAAQAAEPPPPASHTGRTIALVTGGAGIVAIGVSLAFGLAARSAFSESTPRYCSSADTCDARGLQLRERAQTDAALATVIGTAGVAAVVGGTVLFLLTGDASPREHAPLSLRFGAREVGASVTSIF